MSDLVERLRRAMTATEMEFITREAADEIERLRAVLEHIECLDCRCTLDDASDLARKALKDKP